MIIIDNHIVAKKNPGRIVAMNQYHQYVPRSRQQPSTVLFGGLVVTAENPISERLPRVPQKIALFDDLHIDLQCVTWLFHLLLQWVYLRRYDKYYGSYLPSNRICLLCVSKKRDFHVQNLDICCHNLPRSYPNKIGSQRCKAHS